MFCYISYTQDISYEQRLIDSLQKVILEKNKKAEETNKQNISIENSSLNNSVQFTDDQLSKFEKQALDNLNELIDQINIISYKKNSEQRKNDAIAAAMNLFSSEENTVEIRSIKNPNNPTYFRKIRDYLNRLKLLAYSDVKFTGFEINISKKLEKGIDGRWYGTISFCQKMEMDIKYGTIEQNGIKRRTDITCKKIQIVLDREEDTRFGIDLWRVFFGDISVDDYQIK